MAAGHYYAEGDPPGTVRYWDGTQWVGDPIPAPPTTPPPPPGPAGGADERFAGLGIRLGAAVIDGIIGFIVVLILVGALFGTSDGNSFEATASGGGALLIGVLFYVFYLWVVVQFGGTPGKLILGLRITDEDGVTPVGWRGAFMRSLPGLLGNIPFLGVLITLGAAIASLFMISNDPEHRSAYDRIGSTRVVHAKALA
ncbi:MAG: RDD family protein [Actinomycetota bacterium]